MAKGKIQIERRRYPRAAVAMTVDYEWLHLRKKSISQIGNISEGGVMIYAKERPQKGDRLCLSLELFKGEKIEIEASVVWVRRTADLRQLVDYPYAFGVKFNKVRKSESNLIAKFVRKLLGKK